jgi:hypothetical protein
MDRVMLDDAFQTRQCQKLLASVVATALRDLAAGRDQRWDRSRKPGEREMTISGHSFTAARFLFDEDATGVDAYLEWLDIDVGEFRRRLLETIYDPSPRDVGGWEPSQRRMMRINYEAWRKLRHGDTSRFEEDEDDN